MDTPLQQVLVKERGRRSITTAINAEKGRGTQRKESCTRALPQSAIQRRGAAPSRRNKQKKEVWRKERAPLQACAREGALLDAVSSRSPRSLAHPTAKHEWQPRQLLGEAGSVTMLEKIKLTSLSIPLSLGHYIHCMGQQGHKAYMDQKGRKLYVYILSTNRDKKKKTRVPCFFLVASHS